MPFLPGKRSQGNACQGHRRHQVDRIPPGRHNAIVTRRGRIGPDLGYGSTAAVGVHPARAWQSPVHVFSPDNSLLAAANIGTAVSLYDLDRDLARTLDDTPAATASASCLAFSADGATLAVGQADGKITIWDTVTGCKRSTLDGQQDFVVSLAFAPDSTILASSGNGCRTRIWDLASGKERLTITGRMNTSVALCFTPDRRLLAMSDQVSPVIRLWDMASGIERGELHGPAGVVVGLAISPDGRTLAAAGYRGAVTFWELESLTVRRGRLTHAGVRSVAFAPDGRTVATGGFDGTVKLWDLPYASGG